MAELLSVLEPGEDGKPDGEVCITLTCKEAARLRAMLVKTLLPSDNSGNVENTLWRVLQSVRCLQNCHSLKPVMRHGDFVSFEKV